MAYDEYLVERIRPLLARHPLPQKEKRMFGGYGFFISGNMVLGVMQDNLMVKLGDEGTARAIAESPNAHPAVFDSMTMSGWVFVDQTDLDDDALQGWVDAGVEYVSTLPEKLPQGKRA